MKHCNKCNTDKSFDSFHIRKASKDGFAARCKACQKIYDDSRANLDKRVAARMAYSKTARGIERANEAKEAWTRKNPKKRHASHVINNAIRDGKITKKPCEICGETYRIHGHHDDYDKVYDVRWLCSKHHREWHRLNGEAANPF